MEIAPLEVLTGLGDANSVSEYINSGSGYEKSGLRFVNSGSGGANCLW